MPFLNANSVPGISKIVPQDPRPITLRFLSLEDNAILEAKLEVIGTTDLVENARFNSSIEVDWHASPLAEIDILQTGVV